jgi:hypothetical protein
MLAPIGSRHSWVDTHVILFTGLLVFKLFCHKSLGALKGGFRPGLPDGLFSDQKSEFGYILDSLAM